MYLWSYMVLTWPSGIWNMNVNWMSFFFCVCVLTVYRNTSCAFFQALTIGFFKPWYLCSVYLVLIFIWTSGWKWFYTIPPLHVLARVCCSHGWTCCSTSVMYTFLPLIYGGCVVLICGQLHWNYLIGHLLLLNNVIWILFKAFWASLWHVMLIHWCCNEFQNHGHRRGVKYRLVYVAAFFADFSLKENPKLFFSLTCFFPLLWSK